MTAINTELDPALAAILNRAMAKRGDDRYPDLKALRGGPDTRDAAPRGGAGRPDRRRAADAHHAPSPTPSGAASAPGRIGRAWPSAARPASPAISEPPKQPSRPGLDEALAQVELAAEIEPDDPRIVRLHERVRHAIECATSRSTWPKRATLLERGSLTEPARRCSHARRSTRRRAASARRLEEVARAREA